MVATALHFGAISSVIPLNNLARVSKEGRRGPSTIPPPSAGPLFRSGSRISRAPATAPIIRAAAEVQTTEDALMKASTAADVVREFYDGINRRDLAAVEPLISEDCVYEDLVFPRPFVGRKVKQKKGGLMPVVLASHQNMLIVEVGAGVDAPVPAAHPSLERLQVLVADRWLGHVGPMWKNQWRCSKRGGRKVGEWGKNILDSVMVSVFAWAYFLKTTTRSNDRVETFLFGFSLLSLSSSVASELYSSVDHGGRSVGSYLESGGMSNE
ncbi:hypothetical protein BHM03_00027294 [Ensete ventricosum]|nr:hypothetical protein BHM03_00027294 [Ensete ventricosum]